MGHTNTPIGATPFLRTVISAVALLATLSPHAAAQDVTGRVVLTGWQEHVAGAEVHLLDGGRDSPAIATVQTDAQGRFAFGGVASGTYRLRAAYGDVVSQVYGPFELSAAGDPLDIELRLPSKLYELAQQCQASGAGSGTGVLAGIAYDGATTTPVPGARIVVEWTGGNGADNHLEGGTDASGRFVICDVGADLPLRVRAEALGRAGADQRNVRVRPGALARLDLPVALGGAPNLRVLSQTRDRPDSLASVLGQLVDAESEVPIAGAVVRVPGYGREAVTDESGRFRIGDVSGGEHVFHVARLGYDWQSQPVTIAAGASVVLELRASPTAVALEAIVVQASTPESRMARGSTQAQRVIAGARLRDAEERATSFLEIIREFPNLEIRMGRFETVEGVEYGACIESSRALRRFVVPEQRTSLPWCEMIAIVVDGIATIRGGELANLLRVNHIESIELLPPLGAMQYGERAAVNGALVIWTRGRGPHADPARRDLRRPRGGSPR